MWVEATAFFVINSVAWNTHMLPYFIYKICYAVCLCPADTCTVLKVFKHTVQEFHELVWWDCELLHWASAMQTNGQLELAVTKIRRENLTNKESEWIFIEKTEILYKTLFELQQKIKWYYLFLRWLLFLFIYVHVNI